MKAAILNLLMRSDQEDGYLKNVHSLANGQTVTKYSAIYTGDTHVTCVQLSKPDVATLSYRRSHYWWQKER